MDRRSVAAAASGVADQVLLSATNLAVGLALARELDPSRFGLYVVAFAVALAASSLQVSLVTDPLVILGSARQRAHQSAYFSALLRLQLLVGLICAAGVGAVALAFHLAWGEGSALAGALAGAALGLVPWQIQTFFRAVFFARLAPGSVLLNDAVFCAARLGLLLWLILAGAMTPFSALATAGLAALAACAPAAWRCRDLILAPPEPLGRVWAAHWSYGRWMLATAGAYWCSGQAPALLASSLLAPAAAGILKACQYLVAPLNVMLTGLDGIVAPRAARHHSLGGEPALRRFLARFGLLAGGAAALYAAALLPVSRGLMDILYKGRYPQYAPLVGLFLLEAFFSALARAPILRLKVAGETRRIFACYAGAAAVGLGALALLAPAFGVTGAAAAAPAASATLLLGLGLVSRERAAAPHPRASAVIES